VVLFTRYSEDGEETMPNRAGEEQKMKTIKQLRKEKGWSQRELARRANVNQAAISRTEDGLPELGLSSTKRIAREFGVSGEELFLEERARAIRACKRDGDLAGLIMHVRAVAKALEKTDPEGAGQLAEDALRFVASEQLAATKAALDPGEYLDDLDGGRRDLYGRVVEPDPLDTQTNSYSYPGAPSFQPEATLPAIFADSPGGPRPLSNEELFADEGDEPGELDERDYFGRAVKPEEPEPVFEEDDEEDDARDVYGRAIRRRGR
jgi:transcriptional regulator with XRE-family HTH domain